MTKRPCTRSEDVTAPRPVRLATINVAFPYPPAEGNRHRELLSGLGRFARHRGHEAGGERLRPSAAAFRAEAPSSARSPLCPFPEASASPGRRRSTLGLQGTSPAGLCPGSFGGVPAL